jgi:hypothetical protein
MQNNVFGSKHRSNVQGMKIIVEVGNKHGNGDKFPDFAMLFFVFRNKQVCVILEEGAYL